MYLALFYSKIKGELSFAKVASNEYVIRFHELSLLRTLKLALGTLLLAFAKVSVLKLQLQLQINFLVFLLSNLSVLEEPSELWFVVSNILGSYTSATLIDIHFG